MGEGIVKLNLFFVLTQLGFPPCVLHFVCEMYSDCFVHIVFAGMREAGFVVAGIKQETKPPADGRAIG